VVSRLRICPPGRETSSGEDERAKQKGKNREWHGRERCFEEQIVKRDATANLMI